jgi:hypothetical protein
MFFTISTNTRSIQHKFSELETCNPSVTINFFSLSPHAVAVRRRMNKIINATSTSVLEEKRGDDPCTLEENVESGSTRTCAVSDAEGEEEGAKRPPGLGARTRRWGVAVLLLAIMALVVLVVQSLDMRRRREAEATFCADGSNTTGTWNEDLKEALDVLGVHPGSDLHVSGVHSGDDGMMCGQWWSDLEGGANKTANGAGDAQSGGVVITAIEQGKIRNNTRNLVPDFDRWGGCDVQNWWLPCKFAVVEIWCECMWVEQASLIDSNLCSTGVTRGCTGWEDGIEWLFGIEKGYRENFQCWCTPTSRAVKKRAYMSVLYEDGTWRWASRTMTTTNLVNVQLTIARS